VFFSLFFDVEPFAAILIAHGTHGRSQKFVYGGIMKFDAEGREWEKLIAKGTAT